jgi:hypothetical protein
MKHGTRSGWMVWSSSLSSPACAGRGSSTALRSHACAVLQLTRCIRRWIAICGSPLNGGDRGQQRASHQRDDSCDLVPQSLSSSLSNPSYHSGAHSLQGELQSFLPPLFDRFEAIGLAPAPFKTGLKTASIQQLPPPPSSPSQPARRASSPSRSCWCALRASRARARGSRAAGGRQEGPGARQGPEP